MDKLLREMREKIEHYKPLLIEAARPMQAVCSHCGQGLSDNPDGWVSPRQLRDQVYIHHLHYNDSSLIALALFELMDEDVFEERNDFYLRLRPGDETDAGNEGGRS